MQLEWLGTPRLPLAYLLALVRAWAADDSSAIWRALHPGELPLAQRMQIDQTNLTLLLITTVRRLVGDRQAKFEPLYTYEGGPWARPEEKKFEPAGGFVVMDLAEAERWKRDVEARWVKPAV